MSDLPTLGAVIRRQRELSRLSMRQFAQAAGISNPYLSQIERGLREPSQRVVQAIAQSLRTSADALYAEAGITPEAGPAAPPAISAGQWSRSASEPMKSPRWPPEDVRTAMSCGGVPTCSAIAKTCAGG